MSRWPDSMPTWLKLRMISLSQWMA
jgi:hypothetical protein